MVVTATKTNVDSTVLPIKTAQVTNVKEANKPALAEFVEQVNATAGDAINYKQGESMDESKTGVKECQTMDKSETVGNECQTMEKSEIVGNECQTTEKSEIVGNVCQSMEKSETVGNECQTTDKSETVVNECHTMEKFDTVIKQCQAKNKSETVIGNAEVESKENSDTVLEVGVNQVEDSAEAAKEDHHGVDDDAVKIPLEIAENQQDEDVEQTTNSPAEALPPTLVYAEMAQVSRSMHYNDYQQCVATQKFITSKITPKYKTILPKDGQFVWFRAQTVEDTSDKHDWFGNVRCSFDLLKLLKTDPRINLFSVDCAYFGYSSASRILVTYKKKHSQFRKLSLGNLKYGDPIIYSEGKLLFLRKDVSKDQTWWGSHQTEFVIDTRSLGAKRMFDVCDKYAVNHSSANKLSKRGSFIPHQCLIYNSGKRKQCPSPWSQEHTQDLMQPKSALDDNTKTEQ